jgi:predicted transcriptional regulator
MQVLWKLEKGFLREIIDAMPAPKPHQNTVATLLKILVEKNSYVSQFWDGNMNIPLLSARMNIQNGQ